MYPAATFAVCGYCGIVVPMTSGRNRDKHKSDSLMIAEVRVIADLRIMHAKFDELYQLTTALKQRHQYSDIVAYGQSRSQWECGSEASS